MTTSHWIVCESGTCWAAALRTSLARMPGIASTDVVVHESRTLDELSDRAADVAADCILLEIRPNHLDVALRWLSEQTRQPCRVPVVAAVVGMESDRSAIASALREAGAAEVVHSPRELKPALRLGLEHHRCRLHSRNSGPAINQTIEQWAWSLLPWQDAKRPVG